MSELTEVMNAWLDFRCHQSCLHTKLTSEGLDSGIKVWCQELHGDLVQTNITTTPVYIKSWVLRHLKTFLSPYHGQCGKFNRTWRTDLLLFILKIRHKCEESVKRQVVHVYFVCLFPPKKYQQHKKRRTDGSNKNKTKVH